MIEDSDLQNILEFKILLKSLSINNCKRLSKEGLINYFMH